MHKLKLFGLLMLGLLSLVLVGCDGGKNLSTNPAVEKQAAELFGAMQAEDYDRLIAQYDEDFFGIRTPDQWVAEIKAHLAERGPVQAYHLRKSQADTRFSGKFYILEYETVHTGNKRLHHIITLLLPNSGGAIQLLGHKIKPWEMPESKADDSVAQ